MHSAASLFRIFLTTLSRAVALAALLLPFSVQAQTNPDNSLTEQLVNISERAGGQSFAYTYPTASGTTQSLNFRLNLNDIQRGSTEFTSWNNADAIASGLTEARKVATTFEKPTLKIRVDAVGNQLATRLTGLGQMPDAPTQKALQTAVSHAFDAGRDAYARQHLYRVIRKSETMGLIQPDYPTIAARYTAAMQPIATAIQQQVPAAAASPRAFINAALTWLQTIPYDTLQNRATSNGAGFQTPYGLLLGNRGDCDTKTVALAALLRAAYPTLPLSIILVPQHAFLGIGLPQTKSDFALRTASGNYILAEPTGPGLTPLGYIDTRTRTGILTGETDILPVL